MEELGALAPGRQVGLTHEDIPMEEERPVCLPCQNLLTVMTVAPDRQSGIGLAMGERADAMCGVECYSNAGAVDQVQVQLAGDRGRMHRTNGSSSLLEKVDSLLCCLEGSGPIG